MGLFSSQPKREFLFGDIVKVTKGFYQGLQGVVTDREIDEDRYKLSIAGTDANGSEIHSDDWVYGENLELVKSRVTA